MLPKVQDFFRLEEMTDEDLLPVDKLVQFAVRVPPGIASIGTKNSTWIAFLQINFPTTKEAKELLRHREFLGMFGILAERTHSDQVYIEVPFKYSTDGDEHAVRYLLEDSPDHGAVPQWTYVGTSNRSLLERTFNSLNKTLKLTP